jgi:hypothetical protein
MTCLELAAADQAGKRKTLPTANYRQGFNPQKNDKKSK